jgi:aerobic-type carbon monoxide dehydrogenase small subunit (CoxS/CutS family)
VPQCGYRQSGQIMQAVALLARNKILRAPRSSITWTAICRRTYLRIISAIQRAAKET